MTIRLLLLLAVGLIAGPAFADTSVSYRLPSGIILLEEDDRGRMRVSFGPDTYVLFIEGRGYLSERSGRRTQVKDLTSLIRRFSPIVGRLLQPKTSSDAAGVQFTRLPDRATVAGIAGQRIQAKLPAIEEPVEIVATTEPAAAAAGPLIEHLLRNLVEQARNADPKFANVLIPSLESIAAWQRDLGTVLRIGDYIELINISSSAIPVERFTLAGLPNNARTEAQDAARIAKELR